jgi:hypothetical protein
LQVAVPPAVTALPRAAVGSSPCISWPRCCSRRKSSIVTLLYQLKHRNRQNSSSRDEKPGVWQIIANEQMIAQAWDMNENLLFFFLMWLGTY